MSLLGAEGSRAKARTAAILVLVLVAMVGKLAFLTLKVSGRSQQAEVASVLLQHDTLPSRIASLAAERRSLEGELGQVRGQEAARQAAPAEAGVLQQEEQRDASDLKDMQGEGTRADEALVDTLVGESRAARRARRNQALALAARARRRRVRKELEADAAVKLRKAGVPLGDGAQAREEASENGKLAQEVAEMHATLRQDNEAKKRRKAEAEARHRAIPTREQAQELRNRQQLEMGGGTGVGDPLGRAGVEEDSWGPITSDASTKPDPRDSFAFGSQPKAKHPRRAAKKVAKIHDALSTDESLDEALGFKASIMYSKAFESSMAATRKKQNARASEAAHRHPASQRAVSALG